MYTWHDPKFGVSVSSYAVNFIMGLCRLSILGQSWLYRDWLGMMLVSAPESILHKVRVCFLRGSAPGKPLKGHSTYRTNVDIASQGCCTNWAQKHVITG